jgi:hypothetical protein
MSSFTARLRGAAQAAGQGYGQGSGEAKGYDAFVPHYAAPYRYPPSPVIARPPE